MACIHSGDLPEDSRFKGEGGAGDSSELGRRMAALKSGNIDIVVHVGQLVEGFDHPPLSICAIFKAFRCIGSYMQVWDKSGSRMHGASFTLWVGINCSTI